MNNSLAESLVSLRLSGLISTKEFELSSDKQLYTKRFL